MGLRSDRHTQQSLLITLRLKRIWCPTTAGSYTSVSLWVTYRYVCLFVNVDETVFITSWKIQAQVRWLDRASLQSLNHMGSVRQINKLEVEPVAVSTERSEILWAVCIPEFHIPVSSWLKEMDLKIVIEKDICFAEIESVVLPSTLFFSHCRQRTGSSKTIPILYKILLEMSLFSHTPYDHLKVFKHNTLYLNLTNKKN